MDSPPGVEKATRARPSPSRARTTAENAPSRAKVAPAGSVRAGRSRHHHSVGLPGSRDARPRGTQQEALDPATGRALRQQTGGQHGRIVAEENVAGAQEIGQVGEDMMCHRAGAAVDDEQARLIATRRRDLRNEAPGQRVIEKFGAEAHGGGGSGPGPGEVPGPRNSGKKWSRASALNPFKACLLY